MLKQGDMLQWIHPDESCGKISGPMQVVKADNARGLIETEPASGFLYIESVLGHWGTGELKVRILQPDLTYRDAAAEDFLPPALSLEELDGYNRATHRLYRKPVTAKAVSLPHISVRTIIYQGVGRRIVMDQFRHPVVDIHCNRLITEVSDSVAVLPVDAQGRFGFGKEYRHGVAIRRDVEKYGDGNGFTLSLPAGGINDGETPRQAAERELQEEVKLKPGKLTRLTNYMTSESNLTEIIAIYRADDLVPSALEGDQDEHVELVWLTLDEVVAEIRSGRLVSGAVQMALALTVPGFADMIAVDE